MLARAVELFGQHTGKSSFPYALSQLNYAEAALSLDQLSAARDALAVARSVLHKLLPEDAPVMGTVLLDRGLLALEERRTKDALGLLEAAQKVFGRVGPSARGDSWRALAALGRAHLARGELAAAFAALDEADRSPQKRNVAAEERRRMLAALADTLRVQGKDAAREVSLREQARLLGATIARLNAQ